MRIPLQRSFHRNSQLARSPLRRHLPQQQIELRLAQRPHLGHLTRAMCPAFVEVADQQAIARIMRSGQFLRR
jgi:hypothetical protein